MKKILFLIQIVLLLNISIFTTIAQPRKPFTFESYNRIDLIFKGYPIAVTKVDKNNLKITYQVLKVFKGDQTLQQVTGFTLIDPYHPEVQAQQIGVEYTNLYSASGGAEKMGVGRMLIGCEHNDLDCLENYTPECDNYQRAKFILDNGHKTGYVKNFYYKFNGYKFDGKKRVLQWLPLEIEAEGQLKEGQAHGLWKYYDEDSGKLKREVIYQEGTEIGSIYHSEDGIGLRFGTPKLQYGYSFDKYNNLISYSKTEYKPDNDSLGTRYGNNEHIEYYSNGKIKKSAINVLYNNERLSKK